MAGRVERGRPHEAPDTAVRGQLASEVLDSDQEVHLALLVERRPGPRRPLLPVFAVHGHYFTDVRVPTGRRALRRNVVAASTRPGVPQVVTRRSPGRRSSASGCISTPP